MKRFRLDTEGNLFDLAFIMGDKGEFSLMNGAEGFVVLWEKLGSSYLVRLARRRFEDSWAQQVWKSWQVLGDTIGLKLTYDWTDIKLYDKTGNEVSPYITMEPTMGFPPTYATHVVVGGSAFKDGYFWQYMREMPFTCIKDLRIWKSKELLPEMVEAISTKKYLGVMAYRDV